jgi:hypothetical protein
VTYGTTHGGQGGRIDRYYEYFYDPSRLTTFIRHIAVVFSLPLIPKRDLSRPTDAQHHTPVIGPPTAIPATLSQRSIATKGSDREPWSNESIQPFIPSTHRRRFHNFRKLSKYHRSLTSAFHADMLRYKLRRANRELIENRDYHSPFLYLEELIRLPYLVIGLYWVFCLFLIGAPFAGIQKFRKHANDPNYTLCQFRTRHILGFLQCVLRFLQAFFAASIISSFSTMMALVTLVEAILFARRPFQPAKLTGWNRLLYSDWNISHISDMHASIHYSPRNTWLLLTIFCPLATFIFVPNLLSWTVLAISISGLLFLISLMLRWSFERGTGRSDHPWKHTADGQVGSGNEALDECYARLYAKSTLTIWVERAREVMRERRPRWHGRGGAVRSRDESDVHFGRPGRLGHSDGKVM